MNLTLLSNMFKVKYEEMNKIFLKLPKIAKKRRYLMLIDIGKILTTLFTITEKKNLIVTNKDKGLMLVAVLNIVAHYRHYFHSVLKSSNSFVLYCSDPENYEYYNDIIKDIYNFAKYIPSIIVIPKIKTKNRYYYNHVLGYIIDYCNKSTKIKNKELNLVCLGNDPINYQYHSICENTFFIHHSSSKNKVVDYKKVWNDILTEDFRFDAVKYNLYLDKLLYPYLIYHRAFIDKDLPITGIGGTRATTRANMLFEFIDLNRNVLNDENIEERYGKFLGLVDEDIKNCGLILKKIYYYYNPGIKNFIKDLIKSWNQKLHDKKISNINEYYDLFNENNIIILWLKEDQGN
ncbi:MAG: hypothetical protein IJ772_04805 [Bacilli bacterium]|nr:hypothetical protein [Bacilli bacterium]